MKKKKNRKPRETLTEVLRSSFKEITEVENIERDLPRKWEKHGDLILLPDSCFNEEIWERLDQNALWSVIAEHFGVLKVAKKGRICSNGHRTPQVVLLKGDNPWVRHVDNGIKYSYDVTKCMFSAGNITEKMRMGNLKCKDEVIVDMFAGIGYFTLPLLVHGKAKHVHACEWNKDAVVALKKNLMDNKVGEKCSVYEGDNREICPCDVADRVIMGLIPDAMGSILPACKALKVGSGGVMHIHHNVDSKIGTNNDISTLHIPTSVTCNKKAILPEWWTWATETASTVEEIMQKIYTKRNFYSTKTQTEILHIEKVKSYAPHIDHMVLDLKVNIEDQQISS